MQFIKVLGAVGLSFALNVSASPIEPCLEKAAEEFAVPVKVLEAMRQDAAGNKARNPEYAAREHGPMGVSELVIKRAARQAGIDAEKAKTTACENYRVASWFLAHSMKHEKGDIWEAVRSYYFGSKRAHAVQEMADKTVARIQKISNVM